METIKVTKKESIRICHLIKKIRITREEWCNLADPKIKELNTYENKKDSEILIEALENCLFDEEVEVEIMYKHKEEENDKTE